MQHFVQRTFVRRTIANRIATLCAIVLATTVMLALASCGGAGGAGTSGTTDAVPAPSATALAGYPKADMTDYDCAAEYDKDYQFVELAVADVQAEMDKGSSFAVYCGYNHCPWCNSVLNDLNDILLERGEVLGYIDTRKDPAWQSNMDITDYDTFVELFGDALPVDEDGNKHLYVPHIFFIKDGKLIEDHPGTVPSQESPSDPLSEEQIAEYQQTINAYLDAIR